MGKFARIGVISDTHGDIQAWRAAWRIWGDIDFVLHAGDVLYHGPRNPLPRDYAPADLAEAINNSEVPLFVARGNCDSDVDAMVLDCPLESRQVVVCWEGKLIFMEHGDNFSRFRERALRCEADLAICGHTHVGSVVREGKTLFLNPGSASLPKGRDPASVAFIDREGLSVVTLDGELLDRESW